MTILDLSLLRTAELAAQRRQPSFRRLALSLVAASVGLMVLAYASSAIDKAGSPADAQLTMLLRFMAAVKAAMVVGAATIVAKRLSFATSRRCTIFYLAALGLMSLAPGLIWSLDHIALGACCFHAGLLGGLATALADDKRKVGLLRPRRA